VNAHPPEERRSPGGLALLVIFVLMAAGIATAGYFSYRRYERQSRLGVEHQLSAVAELRVGELVQWRRERLADGTAFATDTLFSDLVRQWVQRPNGAVVGAQLRAWLGSVQAAGDYERAILFDERGTHRMSVPETTEPVDSHLLRAAPEVLRSGRVGFLDFHRERPGQSTWRSWCPSSTD